MSIWTTHNNTLLIAILIGALAGIICCGWFFDTAMQSLEWPGILFVDALRIVIPLIIAAVISGVASLGDLRRPGRFGGYNVWG